MNHSPGIQTSPVPLFLRLNTQKERDWHWKEPKDSEGVHFPERKQHWAATLAGSNVCGSGATQVFSKKGVYSTMFRGQKKAMRCWEELRKLFSVFLSRLETDGPESLGEAISRRTCFVVFFRHMMPQFNCLIFRTNTLSWWSTVLLMLMLLSSSFLVDSWFIKTVDMKRLTFQMGYYSLESTLVMWILWHLNSHWSWMMNPLFTADCFGVVTHGIRSSPMQRMS